VDFLLPLSADVKKTSRRRLLSLGGSRRDSEETRRFQERDLYAMGSNGVGSWRSFSLQIGGEKTGVHKTGREIWEGPCGRGRNLTSAEERNGGIAARVRFKNSKHPFRVEGNREKGTNLRFASGMARN